MAKEQRKREHVDQYLDLVFLWDDIEMEMGSLKQYLYKSTLPDTSKEDIEIRVENIYKMMQELVDVSFEISFSLERMIGKKKKS